MNINVRTNISNEYKDIDIVINAPEKNSQVIEKNNLIKTKEGIVKIKEK